MQHSTKDRKIYLIAKMLLCFRIFCYASVKFGYNLINVRDFIIKSCLMFYWRSLLLENDIDEMKVLKGKNIT